jgi:hypothetical protein
VVTVVEGCLVEAEVVLDVRDEEVVVAVPLERVETPVVTEVRVVLEAPEVRAAVEEDEAVDSELRVAVPDVPEVREDVVVVFPEVREETPDELEELREVVEEDF